MEDDLSDYERQRLANIARNNAVMASLGLSHDEQEAALKTLAAQEAAKAAAEAAGATPDAASAIGAAATTATTASTASTASEGGADARSDA